MSYLLVMWSALALGVVTSISPCPLATNIAAISYLGRSVSSTRRVLFSGFLYTVGRMTVYVGLGLLILVILGSSDAGTGAVTSNVSRFLQSYIGIALGPLLILAGMFILGLIEMSASLNFNNQALQQKIKDGGMIWSFPLGVVFALSFCPVSASLFFVGLIGLSTQHSSPILLPTLYGLGTAVPVILFAFIIAFAGKIVGKTFDKLTQIEKWVRLATGLIFILAGIYYILTHIYGLTIFI